MDWTDADWERLGVRLREAREACGLSRRALADKTGVSEKAIQTAEEGRVPSARWPKSIDTLAAALDWGPGSARAVLEGGSPSDAPETSRSEAEMDDLARRMTDMKIAMAAADLARDAERLAVAARQYADLKRIDRTSGGAYQLAQSVADLLRQASRLDGMRDIAALVPDTEK